MSATPDTLRIRYSFLFESLRKKEFEILLHPCTLDLIPTPGTQERPWTLLQYSRCSNCPLPQDHRNCPVAYNLTSVVEAFADVRSYEPATITVETPERTYSKKTTAEKGLSSIIGIYMVTSGCPIMNKLRPMVRFHLPFATPLETFYRSISMYLTAQFFRLKAGKIPDWSLENHVHLYKEISQVNKGISKRLFDASQDDANVNAIVIWHSVGDGIQYFVESDLEEVRELFRDYVAA